MKFIFLFALVGGCASTPVRIAKEQWKLCWNLCGQKDKLSAVEGKTCICEGGYKVNSEPEKAPEPPSAPFSLGEWLGLKGGSS